MPADCVYEHFALASSQTKHIGIGFIRIGERPKDRFRKSRFENGSEMVPIDLHQNVAKNHKNLVDNSEQKLKDDLEFFRF